MSAAKRRKTATGNQAIDSAQLQLSASIAKLASTKEAFASAVKAHEQWTEETIRDISLQIGAKKAEYDELESSFEVAKKNGQIELDQTLKQYGYDAAIKLISERNQVAIDKAELETLRSTITNAQEQHAAELEKAINHEKSKSKKGLEAAVKHAKLTHDAETAKLAAGIEQKTHEIEYLKSQVQDYKEELEKTRATIRHVAEAGSKAVNQTFGAKN